MGNWKRGLRLAAPLLILPLGFLAYRPSTMGDSALGWGAGIARVMTRAGNLRRPDILAPKRI